MPRRAVARAGTSATLPMFTLALVVWLAPAAPEAATRVPGTRFRLGMTESQVLALGAFAEVKASDAAGTVARAGGSRFFGVPGDATLYLRDGRLARLRFVATGVSPHSSDYVQDQLRRMGLAPECLRNDRGDRVCDWMGTALKVHVEIQEDRLEARAERWPPPEQAVTESLRAGAGTTGHGVPPTGRSAPAGRTPEPATRKPAPKPATTTTGTPARRDSTGPSGPPGTTPVAMLPETLTVSLAASSPEEWPRIVSSSPLQYPEAARGESVQGVVWVLALADSDGRVLDATIERGIRELDAAALAWVSRSRFAPCTLRGEPCRFRVRVPVRFTLY